ncbi:MAG: 4Fe-4S dicluster domain-containing protein [Candidatus Omnitrophica bacterium]|nr:4Fe-4S dicluster domain-containing protein [Candidatus Omnitrophota bacterium]
MIEEIRQKAKELLAASKVDMVIGYRRSGDGVSTVPAFIDSAQDVDSLVWDQNCVYNLANYLREFPGKKIGVVAKGCDARAIVVLLQENQLERENLFIIGVECGVTDISEKCAACPRTVSAICDILIKEKGRKSGAPGNEKDAYAAVEALEARRAEERLGLWREEFSRCIRCYACRQVCPMCYCPKCVADQTMPAWFSKATSLEGNFAWNVTRAFHLAGRCVDCGECERACPVGIPLRDLNKKLEKEAKELYKYEAGSSVEAKPLFASYDKDDPKDFIK